HWIVRVRSSERIDCPTMQIIDLHSEIAFQFRGRAVDIHTRIRGIVALPYRNRRAPEAFAGDVPIPRVLQPFAECSVPNVGWDPIDVLVQLDHAVLELADRDVPAVDGLVD